MKIYGTPISPFVRMAIVAAHECGLGNKVEVVTEGVDPTKANEKLTALSALGKIPILETDHHHPIFDSRVIMEYLAHVAGNKTLIPDDGVKRFRILTLLALAQGLGDSAVGYRYETATRPKELQWKEWIARTEVRFNDVFDELEKNWQHELADVNAGSIGVAAVLAYIDFRMPQLNWRNNRPALDRFHAAFVKRDSMVKTSLDKA